LMGSQTVGVNNPIGIGHHSDPMLYSVQYLDCVRRWIVSVATLAPLLQFAFQVLISAVGYSLGERSSRRRLHNADYGGILMRGEAFYGAGDILIWGENN